MKKTTFDIMKGLLLQLCQHPFVPTKRDLLKELLNQIQDWNKTVELINAHGIIALAAYNIKEAGLENEIPSSAMEFLENGYRQSVIRNLWLKERWKEADEILKNAGIKHLLLKGMALEHTIYGSRGLRQMSDNDILIKREDALKAWNLLQKSGFRTKTIKSPLHKKILPETGKHLPSLFKDGYIIEIHTRLYETDSDMGTDYPKLFDNAAGLTIDDRKALMLPQEVHLKYLLQHFERHALEGVCQLRLYSDIILLDKINTHEFPDEFILSPDQSHLKPFRNAAYKASINSIPSKYRTRFLLGDLFPSVKWMKERHGCGGLKALFYYPHRVGKLWWLW